MADIFISYASVDRPLVRCLADALETRGWSVWWDHHNLRGGQHFDLIIEEAISTARAVIVVWSPDSTKSNWVRAEAAQALEQEKLVPLRIGMAVLPLRFRNIHTIDLSSWTGETDAEPFERLVKDLGHYLGPPTPSNRSEHPGIPAAPDPQTAAPVVEDQQPAKTAPIAESSRASPRGDSPHASIITTQPTLTTGPPPRAGRKRVGKYFAVVAVTGGILWGVVVLKERQPAPTNPPIEATVSKPPDPKPPDPPADAGAAKAAYDRGDYTTALSSARPAAERGDRVAQYILGVLYRDGLGVPRDYAEAVRWFRKAADQGNADAQSNLGVLYQNGWGVAQDYAEAVRWFRKAADQGSAYAQTSLGILYRNGLGVAQDYAEAARCYRKAADQGHAAAQYNLGLLYQNGWGVAQDKVQARAWMQKAAAAGDEDAKKWLARN